MSGANHAAARHTAALRFEKLGIRIGCSPLWQLCDVRRRRRTGRRWRALRRIHRRRTFNLAKFCAHRDLWRRFGPGWGVELRTASRRPSGGRQQPQWRIPVEWPFIGRCGVRCSQRGWRATNLRAAHSGGPVRAVARGFRSDDVPDAHKLDAEHLSRIGVERHYGNRCAGADSVHSWRSAID